MYVQLKEIELIDDSSLFYLPLSMPPFDYDTDTIIDFFTPNKPVI